jgi:RNA polymerase sigma factor (sigma-70 family)
MATMDDWELLQDYARTHSESAFAELVGRHIDWIYSVALRQVGNSQLAEDVAQSVFALLARKAGTLRSGTLLGGWLFRSTCFVAKCSLRAERRRKFREETASTMMTTAQSDDSEVFWQQLAPYLEHAVASLSEVDRSVVLLRFYERKSLSEIGQRLQISEEAAKKRVSRSVDKLREFLTRRGITMGAAAIGAVLLEKTVQAAPATLSSSIVSASTAGTAFWLPQLARETLNAWRWAKIKLASAAVACVALLTFVLNHSISNQAHKSGGPLVQANKTSSVTSSPLPDTNASSNVSSVAASSGPKFLFRAVSAETGKGIPAARVPLNFVVNGEWVTPAELVTDSDGLCAIPLPEGKLGRLDVGILKDGFVQKFYTWRSDSDEPLPVNYTLKLERAVSIGGRVEDSLGKPVSDAAIAIQFAEIGDASFREPARERLGFVATVTATHTDAQGNWHCSLTPPGYSDFQIIAKHPNFVERQIATDSDQPSSRNPDRLRMADLWAAKAVLRLEKGFQLSGLVLDDEGKPLANARVSWMGNQRYVQEGVKTQSDGTFRLVSLPAGYGNISAWLKGFAPSLAYVEISSATPQLVFRLNRGASFPIWITDEDGVGISGAWTAIDLPQPHNADMHVTTGPDGRAMVEGIPTNAVNALVFHAGASGYVWVRNISLNLREEHPTIRLTKSLHVSGTVSDADTHEQISDFKAIPCSGEELSGYDRSATKRGQWGNYAVNFSEARGPYRVRIEADGYEPAMSPPMAGHPCEQVQDFLLHKKDTNNVIRGTVMLQDGQPAANIAVALLTFQKGATLYNGSFTRGGFASRTTTDAQGNFKFDFDAQAHTMVAADPTFGFAKLRMHRATQPFTLQLQPWGRIEGRLILSGRPVPDQQVFITSDLPPYRSVREGLYAGFDTIKTDFEGRFSCDLVPPGDFTIYLSHGEGQSLSHQTVGEVRAGETTQVQIGGTGRPVTGKLVMSDGTNVDWSTQLISASLSSDQQKPITQPPHEATSPEDVAGKLKLLDFFDDSQEWRAYERSSGSYPLQVAADGTFTAEGIPPGPYLLNASLAESPSIGNSPDPIARFQRKIFATLRQEIVIPESIDESIPVDLGTFTAKSNLAARK